MSLKTRLDGRSKDNKSFEVLDRKGEVVAMVTTTSEASVQLTIDTPAGFKIRKESGWESKPA